MYVLLKLPEMLQMMYVDCVQAFCGGCSLFTSHSMTSVSELHVYLQSNFCTKFDLSVTLHCVVCTLQQKCYRW